MSFDELFDKIRSVHFKAFNYHNSLTKLETQLKQYLVSLPLAQTIFSPSTISYHAFLAAQKKVNHLGYP
jgi:hypothetical protein